VAKIELPANFTPRHYQRPIMAFFDRGGKRAFWCVHRRGGKDRTMLAQISKMAHQRIGTYWHMLPTLKQARKAVWDNITLDGKRLIDATFPPEIVAKRNETEMKIELKCGSIIQLMGADNFDSNVGANPVHVTFSEFALTHPRAWHLVRPILTENNGTAAFISTPRGYNSFYEIGEVARKDDTGRWYYAVMPIDVTGVMTREQVEQEVREGMPENLARQEYYCDFSAANVGSILGPWLEAAHREGRLLDDLVADPDGSPLELSGDLGFNDTCAWWLWQRLPGGWFACLAYVEDSGLDAQDWLDRFNERLGWTPERIGQVWLPHDARAKTFATRTSALEQFRAAGYKTDIVPQVSVTHRINAARTIARRTVWNSVTCEIGLKALRDWQYEYDEERRTYSKNPDHNWASHGSDAFSYGALTMESRSIALPTPKEVKQFARTADRGFALEELWDTAPMRSSRV
jgi:hypothetical protein